MTDSIIFKSGRSIEPNSGYVGLSPRLQVSEGYDGTITIPWVSNYEGDFTPPSTNYSPEDAIELAEIMIARWTAFREQFTTTTGTPS